MTGPDNDEAASGDEAEGTPGTGGLTFEPPRSQSDDVSDIGFAPDLETDAPLPSAAEVAAPPRKKRSRTPPSFSPSVGSDIAADAAGAELYPRALAALARLLDEPAPGAPAEDEPPAAPGPSSAPESLDAFSVGADVTRAPAAIARPPEEPSEDDSSAVADVEGKTPAEDMLELALLGSDDDGEREIHLVFKEDVFGGLYLQLTQGPDGLFASFRVADASTRRAVEGRIDELLMRLRDKGLRVAGYEVTVGDSDA